MQVKMTNAEIKGFLQDYKDRCEIEFLEEGSKEKNDLIESARKRGILLEGSRDLGALKTIFLFTDQYNANGALVSSKGFQKILPQIVGKPMDILHDRKLIVGFYIDYRYIMAEKKAIVYAIFFKSNYPDLWEKAQELKKKKKLSSSFEIWAEKKEYNKDGTYVLKNIELAGGALIFEEDGNEPAFKNAKVLSIAKKELKQMVDEKCLCYASKYNEDEIITSAEEVKVEEKKVEAPKVEIKPEEKPKIKCSNCGEEFESGLLENIKCPKCFAIVNRAGQMIYPPQIKDFKLLCPACSVNNWLIKSNTQDNSVLKCLGCAKEYKVTFATKKEDTTSRDFTFLYTSKVRCLQCGHPIYVAGFSSIKNREIKCDKCGLSFDYNITNERYRKISKIEEFIDNITKSSEKGGTEMAKEEKEVKASEEKEYNFLEKSEVENKEEISKRLVTVKEEAKVEESKTEEPKPEETKVETKVEEKTEAEAEPKKEEAKVEETPQVEEKQETSKEEKPVETAKEEEGKPEEAPKEEKIEEPKSEDKAKEEQPKEEAKIEEAPKAEEKVEEPKYEKKEYEYEVIGDNDDEIDLGELEKAFSCSCIKCGHKMDSGEKHCQDLKCPKCGGQMRRAERPGAGQPRQEAELTTKQRNALPDNMFAVVVTVKNKKTGKPRKIRMFPINDEAHVRNALARLGQPAPQATLKRLGVSVEAVKAKILKRARQLKMTKLIERYKSGVRKVAKKYKELRKSMDEKIEFYKNNAKTIIERRAEVKDYEISDEDLLNDDKFAKAKLEIENAQLKANLEVGSEVVGSKTRTEEWYAERRKKIDKQAFRKPDYLK